MNNIKESDWRHLRGLKDIALDRFCSRVLAEVAGISSNPSATPHEKYQKLYELIQEQDKELGRLFDNLRRFDATGRIFMMRLEDLITDEEWSGFSEELRDTFTRIRNL